MGIYIIYVVQSPLMCMCIVEHSSANRSIAAHGVSSHELPGGFSLYWNSCDRKKSGSKENIYNWCISEQTEACQSFLGWLETHGGHASCSATWEVLCVCPCQFCAEKQQRSSFMFIKAHWIPSSRVPTALHMLPATPCMLCSFLLLKKKHFSPSPTLSPLAWSTGSVHRYLQRDLGFVTGVTSV